VRARWARLLGIAAVFAGIIGIVGHTLGGIAGIWEFYRVSRHDDAAAQRRTSSAARPFRSVAVLPLAADHDADRPLARALTLETTAAATRMLREGLVVSNGLAQESAQRSRDPRRIGAELNVRYVVDGRVLAIELIDALDGSQLWTASQTVMPDDPAATSARLVNPLRAAIANATRKEVRSLPKTQRDAWELVFRGDALSEASPGSPQSQQLYEEALRLDRAFVPAMLGLQGELFLRAQNEPQRRAEIVKRFDEVSRQAVSLAPDDPRLWVWRAHALQWQDNWSASFEAIDRALRIDPFRSSTLVSRAALMVYTARATEALATIARAAELQGDRSGSYWIECLAYLQLERNAEAVAPCESAATWHYWVVYALPLVAHAHLGNVEKAAAWKKKMLEANPSASIASFRDLGVSKHPDYVAASARFQEGLRKAGVPER
jgi:TolB-like protein